VNLTFSYSATETHSMTTRQVVVMEHTPTTELRRFFYSPTFLPLIAL
jgi:hypothetical protein